MLLNTEELLTIANFASLKQLSRQHVYRLIESNEITKVEIDGVLFILQDEKSKNFLRKRKRNV